MPGEGAVGGGGGRRLLRVVPRDVRVTPRDATAAARLTVACPCGGAWAAGVERVLTACLPAACPDTVVPSRLQGV